MKNPKTLRRELVKRSFPVRASAPDRRNVFDFPPRPRTCFHPRPGVQKAGPSPTAKNTSQPQELLASANAGALSHRRQLVHVARLPTRRLATNKIRPQARKRNSNSNRIKRGARRANAPNPTAITARNSARTAQPVPLRHQREFHHNRGIHFTGLH